MVVPQRPGRITEGEIVRKRPSERSFADEYGVRLHNRAARNGLLRERGNILTIYGLGTSWHHANQEVRNSEAGQSQELSSPGQVIPPLLLPPAAAPRTLCPRGAVLLTVAGPGDRGGSPT
jgi:hypothetical protein